jgi:hypothetical protein
MDFVQDTLHQFENCIRAVSDENRIWCLAGRPRNWMVNGKQIATWYTQVAQRARQVNSDFDYMGCFDDLVFISDEIYYFTAVLHLYAPYMNNPLKEAFNFDGTIVYPYNQNMEGKRFNMYANIVSEKCYNYWDRIGDLIASIFPTLFDTRRTYFVPTIIGVPERYKQSSRYQWLYSFAMNEYREMNRLRKDVVHTLSLDTLLKSRFLDSVTNKNETEVLMEERSKLPNFFNCHISHTIEGFDRAVSFVEEVLNSI